MRIAVVGTGISGLATAWLLDRHHDVTVFEKDERLGGHSNTATVDYDGHRIDVDTGFIVYNERNYPNLVNLFKHLNVKTESSVMSFSASLDNGRIEYAGSAFSTLFAQKRNLIRPSFLLMLKDFSRFCRLGKAVLRSNKDSRETLGQFLDAHAFTSSFCNYYLLPMAAAIWSAPCAKILDYPSVSFLRFFANHGLLDIGDHPQWRTVSGGSINYVRKLASDMDATIKLSHAPRAIKRHEGGVDLFDRDGQVRQFDHVVLACHADQALALFVEPTERERSALGAVRFQENKVYLHRDSDLMPQRRAAWASWNYAAGKLSASENHEMPVSATYWMNKLQNIDDRFPLFVTLNPIKQPKPETIFAEYSYDHPILDREAHVAQAALSGLQGQGNVWYAGAWLGYGFHEDGVVSAISVAKSLGVETPWSLGTPGAKRVVSAVRNILPQPA